MLVTREERLTPYRLSELLAKPSRRTEALLAMASFLTTSCTILFFRLKLMKVCLFKRFKLQRRRPGCGKGMGVLGKEGKMFSVNAQVGFEVASESRVKA